MTDGHISEFRSSQFYTESKALIRTPPLPFDLGSLAGVGDGRDVLHNVLTGFRFASSTLTWGNCARLNITTETKSKLHFTGII